MAAKKTTETEDVKPKSYIPAIETAFNRADAFMCACKGIEKMVEEFSPITDGVFRLLEGLNIKNPDKKYVKYLATITHSFVAGLEKKMNDSPEEFSDLTAVYFGNYLGTCADTPNEQLFVESCTLSLYGVYQSLVDAIEEVKKMFYDSDVSSWKKMYYPEIEKAIKNLVSETEQYINDSETILQQDLTFARVRLPMKVKITEAATIWKEFGYIFDALQDLYVVYAGHVSSSLLGQDLSMIRECGESCDMLKNILAGKNEDVVDDEEDF